MLSTAGIITIVVVLVAFVTGAVRGFVRQAGTLGGLILGIVACRMWGEDISRALTEYGSGHDSVVIWVAYALLFIAVYLCVALIARLAHKFLCALSLGFIDRLGGGILRVCLWMILYSLALNIYLAVRPADRESLSAPARPWLGMIVDLAPSLMGNIINQDYADFVNTSKTNQ